MKVKNKPKTIRVRHPDSFNFDFFRIDNDSYYLKNNGEFNGHGDPKTFKTRREAIGCLKKMFPNAKLTEEKHHSLPMDFFTINS